MSDEPRALDTAEVLTALKHGEPGAVADFIEDVHVSLTDAWIKASLVNALRRIEALEKSRPDRRVPS